MKQEHFSYLVMGLETCPTTNRRHYQGYAELKKQLRISSIKEIFEDNALHIEKRRGSAQEASDYCKKEASLEAGTLIEFGQMSNPGKRSDLESMVTRIKEGATNLQLLEEHPATYIKYHRAVSHVRLELGATDARRWRSLDVAVIYGNTGVGKTRKVFESHPPEEIFKLDAANSLWWDGYHGEPTLLIDDFYGWIKYGLLLNVLDGYPLRLEIKGGFTWARWTRVYITSNKHPREWYRGQGLTPALARRITNIVRADGPDLDTEWHEEDIQPNIPLQPGGSDRPVGDVAGADDVLF